MVSKALAHCWEALQHRALLGVSSAAACLLLLSSADDRAEAAKWTSPITVTTVSSGFLNPPLGFGTGDTGLLGWASPLGGARIVPVNMSRPIGTPAVPDAPVSLDVNGSLVVYGKRSVAAVGTLQRASTDGTRSAAVAFGTLPNRFGAPKVIGPRGTSVERIDVASTSSGAIAALITSRTREALASGTSALYLAVRRPQRPFTTTLVMNISTPVNAPRAVAVANSGAVTAVWSEGGAVRIARKVPREAAVVKDIAASQITSVAVAASPAGSGTVVWRDGTGTHSAALDAAGEVGQVLDLERRGATSSAACRLEPSPIAVEYVADTAVAVWRDDVLGQSLVRAARLVMPLKPQDLTPTGSCLGSFEARDGDAVVASWAPRGGLITVARWRGDSARFSAVSSPPGRADGVGPRAAITPKRGVLLTWPMRGRILIAGTP